MQIKVKDVKQIILEEKLNEQKLLIEAIDEDLLKKLNESLSKIDNIAQKYNLGSLQQGIERASRIIEKAMTRGSIKDFFIQKLAPDSIKKYLTGITGVSAMEATLAQGFRALPAVVSFASRTLSGLGSERIGEDKPLSVSIGANPKLLKRIENMINEAFTPPGFLQSFWWGNKPPFVNKKALIDEILELSLSQVSKLAEESKSLGITSVPIEKGDIKRVANLAQAKDEFVAKMRMTPRPSKPKKPRITRTSIHNFIKNNMDVEESQIDELISFLQKQGIRID